MNSQSKIGLGSVQFGLPYGISNRTGQTPVKEVEKIMAVAYAAGINIIDTAAGYGSSEAVIGSLHNNRFSLVTKFGPAETAVDLRQQLESSLTNLDTSSVYGFLAHRPMDLLENKSVWNELQYLKSAGKVERIGFSFNAPDEYHKLKAAGMLPDLVQVPYSYFDTRFREVLIELKAMGCEVHTRSTFLQGLFFTDPDQLPSFFDELKPRIAKLQKEYPDGLEGLLLSYVMKKPFVDKVIVGVEDAQQLQYNLESCNNAHILEDLDITFSRELIMPMYWPKN